jgi:hypothetical protein
MGWLSSSKVAYLTRKKHDLNQKKRLISDTMYCEEAPRFCTNL